MKPDPLEELERGSATYPEAVAMARQVLTTGNTPDVRLVARALIALDEQVKAYREALEVVAKRDPFEMQTDEFMCCAYCRAPEDSTLLSSPDDWWNPAHHAADCEWLSARMCAEVDAIADRIEEKVAAYNKRAEAAVKRLRVHRNWFATHLITENGRIDAMACRIRS